MSARRPALYAGFALSRRGSYVHSESCGCREDCDAIDSCDYHAARYCGGCREVKDEPVNDDGFCVKCADCRCESCRHGFTDEDDCESEGE